jgi:hypothetical protein
MKLDVDVVDRELKAWFFDLFDWEERLVERNLGVEEMEEYAQMFRRYKTWWPDDPCLRKDAVGREPFEWSDDPLAWQCYRFICP